MGGEPDVRWRSEAPRSMTVRSTSAKSKSMVSPIGCSRWSPYPCHLADGRDAVLDLLEPVLAQRDHALLECDGTDLVGGRALHRQLADLVRHGHHLVEADPAPVARAVAAPAAHGLVGLHV